MFCATAKPKVTNIDKKRNPAEEDNTSIKIQLKPSKIKYVANAKGSVKKGKINERHRHRYEFNNTYKESFIKNGMKTSGINDNLDLVEVIELDNHPWFIGTQYHPEYSSRVLKPHPLFVSFVKKIKSINDLDSNNILID